MTTAQRRRIWIGKNVRAEAARQGWRQQDLAGLLGVAQGSISCRLSGQTPFTADELAILAEAFGVPVSLLYEPVADSTMAKGVAR